MSRTEKILVLANIGGGQNFWVFFTMMKVKEKKDKNTGVAEKKAKII